MCGNRALASKRNIPPGKSVDPNRKINAQIEIRLAIGSESLEDSGAVVVVRERLDIPSALETAEVYENSLVSFVGSGFSACHWVDGFLCR